MYIWINTDIQGIYLSYFMILFMGDLYIMILSSRGQTSANYGHTFIGSNYIQQKQSNVCISHRTVKSCCEFLCDKCKTFLYFDILASPQGTKHCISLFFVHVFCCLIFCFCSCLLVFR